MKKQLFSVSALLIAGAILVLQSCSKEDTTAPDITIAGGNAIYHSLNETFTVPAATATDDEDEAADLTITSPLASEVNVDLVGVYTLTYKCTDAAGNEGTATLTVTVRNDAYELEGTYTGGETDANGPYTYVQDNVITADSVINNKVWLTRLGDFANNTVYMTIVGTSITIPSQIVSNVGTGSNSCDVHNRQTSGDGTIISTGFTLDYDDSKVSPCTGSRTGVMAAFVKQ